LGIGPREGVLLRAILGLAIVTNGAFTAYVCDIAATRPSFQITLGRLVITTRRITTNTVVRPTLCANPCEVNTRNCQSLRNALKHEVDDGLSRWRCMGTWTVTKCLSLEIAVRLFFKVLHACCQLKIARLLGSLL